MESIVGSEILGISIDVVLRYDCNSANVIDLQWELDYQIKVIEIFKIYQNNVVFDIYTDS